MMLTFSLIISRSASIFTRSCPIAVSYTHLDVYKRQVQKEEKDVFQAFADPDPAYGKITGCRIFLIVKSEAERRNLVSGFLQDMDLLQNTLVIIKLIIDYNLSLIHI